jgi:hypothetical protein
VVGSQTGCVVSLAMGNIPGEGFMTDVADFDEKLKEFDLIYFCYFCPGAGGPRIHRLYRKLLHDSRHKDRIRTSSFTDIM